VSNRVHSRLKILAKMTTTLETPDLLTFTISIVVFFGGADLNRCIAPLRRWNIPDAVTGGLLASLVTPGCLQILRVGDHLRSRRPRYAVTLFFYRHRPQRTAE
jgi:Na+/glutamate symporter